MSTRYWYNHATKTFVESTGITSHPCDISITEQEYLISRLIVRGYTKEEIKQAVEKIFKLMGD